MSASATEPIAIIGMGCRFPGGVETPDGLWELTAEGRQTVGPVPADRWDAARLAALHDPQLKDPAAVGCFLEGDVWAWEPEALSVAPTEREWVDPQSRVMMEVAWEAVEHAGIPTDLIRGSRTGVYVGTYAPDNLFREARPIEDPPNSPYLFGNYAAGPAGRVAFAMDLRGPAMVVSTHCSSSLVALDVACGALTLGECDMALAGGVLLMLAPQTHYLEAPLLLSRHGACYAFDSRADGYVRGEGAGAVLLKRLSDALRDGDRVLSVIRGSTVNNDGQATRMTAPSTEMQQDLFRAAVEKAAIDPGEVGLVEAHGPGTGVGDPIEYTSINAVYGKGQGRCALGSIKTNIGHSEPVSGIAGLIKAVECLRRGMIAPNQNFAEWNPGIDRTMSSRLFVPTELARWPVKGVSRLAAVCSYGVSGTNSHVVLEAAPTTRRRTASKKGPVSEAQRLFLLSGNSAESLAASASRLADWATAEGAAISLADTAHTLAVRRSHADHRLAVIAGSVEQMAERAQAFAEGKEPEGTVSGTPVLPPNHPGPVFVFTGQGSQYPGMCRNLLKDEPVFARAVEELEPLIQAEAGFSLRESIARPDGLAGVDRIQPTLFGTHVALAALWRSWGVEPVAVIGQSLGEVAASVVAGVLSPADGVKVICRRSSLLAGIARGAMALVMLSAAETQAAIDAADADEVSLGVLTGPRTTVISGDTAQIHALVEHWNTQDVMARMVDVDVASHSAQVDPIIDELHAVLAELPARGPDAIAFYSTVSDDPRDPGPLDASYWVHNQRDTVHFQRAVTAALNDGYRLFIECTAHPLASRPILDIAREEGIEDLVAVGSLRRDTDDQEAFLAHLATVHAAGYNGIDLAAHYGEGRLADLPTTAWNRVHHGGTSAPYALVAPQLPAATQHPLLGAHLQDPDQPQRHLWQTPISPLRLPWLADHRVADVPVLPGTGYAEMLLSAGAEIFGTDHISLDGLRVEAPLILDPEPQVTVRLIQEDDQQAYAEVITHSTDGLLVHARAAVRALPDSEPVPDPDLLHQPTDAWIDMAPADLHRHFRERHDVFHGPAFTSIDRIRLHPDRDRAVSSLQIDDTARVSAAALRLHPALADEFVQTAVAAWLAYCSLSPGPVVVAGFDQVRIYGPTGHARFASITLHHTDDLSCTASGLLTTADGTVIAELRGLRLTNITPPEQRYTDRLAHLAWSPEPPSEQVESADQRWLVIAPAQALWSERLHHMLSERTADSRLLTYPSEQPLEEQALTEALGETLPSCSDVLLTLDGQDTDGTPTAALHAVRRTLCVLRHLAARTTPTRLWVLWRGDEVMSAAGVRGLLRSAAFEHPELRPSSMEICGDTPLEAVLPDLLSDVQQIREIAWRHGVRHLARVRPGPAPHATPAVRAALIRSDGSYLITGGLGGLGLLSARRLIARGARHLVLVGRSDPTPSTAQELENMRALGIRIDLVLGDIAAPEVIHRALNAASGAGDVLRGIIHAAGVVEDATLANLDDALLERVWRGKAEGSWALHQASLRLELDFFVAYSSVASLIGSPGQGAYAAANAYLDTLIAHRSTHGLAATGINWGAWSEAGRGQHLADRGFIMINPDDGLDALERILDEGHHQVAYSPIDPDLWTDPYPALRSSALLADLLTGHRTTAKDTGPSVRDTLLAMENASERHRTLQEFIIGQVRELLGSTTRHIGPHTSLVLLGLDSLGAVQLQQHLSSSLRTTIQPGVIWTKPSAAALADWLLNQMGLDASPVFPNEVTA